MRFIVCYSEETAAKTGVSVDVAQRTLDAMHNVRASIGPQPGAAAVSDSRATPGMHESPSAFTTPFAAHNAFRGFRGAH
jgi:hypothetical protein